MERARGWRLLEELADAPPTSGGRPCYQMPQFPQHQECTSYSHHLRLGMGNCTSEAERNRSFADQLWETENRFRVNTQVMRKRSRGTPLHSSKLDSPQPTRWADFGLRLVGSTNPTTGSPTRIICPSLAAKAARGEKACTRA